MEINPIAVILVYMDSKGDRLLYRYPYEQQAVSSNSSATNTGVLAPPTPTATTCVPQLHEPQKKSNPYAVLSTDDLLQTPPQSATNICPTKGTLQGFTDEVLSTLFAVKPQLCNQKFELKINDVRFVSHPTLVQRREPGTTSTGVANSSTALKPIPQQMLINIVFALHAHASYSIVKCYYELSKRLGMALKMEEQRIGYVSDETSLMARTHDEVSTQQQPQQRAFELITERCALAQALKSIYHDLCTTGLLSTTLGAQPLLGTTAVNQVTLSFCLPQKAHQLHKKGSLVDPETIDRCLRSLKPYHGMLLLVDFAELLDCVPPPGARMLLQLVEVYTPLMSLQSMASDADMSLEHVYKLVSHLVYWAKATIIYPLCETNVYVIAPDAPLHTKSHLVEKFGVRFPGMSLFEVISDFSLPTSIGHLTTPLQQPARQGILAQMVLWMLQHHLLMQLHTYVQFMPGDVGTGNVPPAMAAYMQASSLLMEGDLHDLAEEDEDQMEEDDVIEELEMETTKYANVKQEIFRSSVHSPAASAGDLEELTGDSLLSMSSQPLPVPRANRNSMHDDRYSVTGSDIVAQPCSSHKSNFSMTASLSSDNCDDSIASIEDEEKIKELLEVFDEKYRPAIKAIPACSNVDDLSLMVKLFQAGYFKSEHHLEEIMYFENLRRSQLLQLLDKFRDVLIIYETEDPAIATMYNNNNK